MRNDIPKRVLDLAIALPIALLSLPIQAVTAVLVRFKLGRPVLFRQVRPGLHGEPFTLYKFRTMRPLDPSRDLVTDEARLTRFGQTLRSSSLDELPSLWNVVRGDMSLVGPRPLLMEYLELYTPEQAQRHDVRPGLTGLAQISGRNGLAWEERFRLDVEYVQSESLRLDLRIIALTVRTVLRREGITAHGQATMEQYLGTFENGDQ